jgi:hypothetical protein
LVRVSESDPPTFDETEEIAYLHSTAALRLGEATPDLAAAQLVIDTVSAMLNAGGERLGEHVALYRNALAEMQQAYVRAASAGTP